MKFVRLFLLEFFRLLQSPFTWLTALATALSPLAGLLFYQPAQAGTMATQFLANPALAGGVCGGIFFALLTLEELDRASRSRVEVLADAAVPPRHLALLRLLALIAAAALCFGVTAALWFPASRRLIGSVFDTGDYVLAYGLFMGLALPLSILAASSAYHFTRRTDLSLALVAAFSGLSLTVWAGDWQLCWLNPSVWALSDDFSNLRIFRSVAYMRLTWLGALGGVWVISWLFVRQWGKGPLASFLCGIRRPLGPLLALCLLAGSVSAWAAQPLVDHSNPDLTVMTFDALPMLEGVTCSRRSAQVFPDTHAGTVSGKAVYQLQNRSGSPQTAALAVNPGYSISSVLANGTPVPFSPGDYEEYNEAMAEVTLPADPQIELEVEYGGFPQESRSMSTMQGRLEISGQYLCLENSALIPRLLNVSPEGEERYPTSVEIILPSHMTVIPFCASEAAVTAVHSDGTSTWSYEYTGSGGILYAGDYLREDIFAGGLSIQFYYGRKHQAVMEAAGAAEAIQAVVDYCTEHYGPLSFGADGSLKLIQSRVSGGGYATNGASLLDEADFTAANLNDQNKGTAPGEVMIHELVHQWWGLANMFAPGDPKDPWSAEGLTCYTTYRIAKELYGEDYAAEHYVNPWKQAVEDYHRNFYVRNPQYLSILPEEERLQITNRLAELRQYCEMPLKIRKAETLVGGEAAMDGILRGLFQRELDWAYPYLTYEEFLDACGLEKEELDFETNCEI